MTTVNNQATINPHMKFEPIKKGVIVPPNVYQYSSHDELQLGENQYKEIVKSLNRSRMARFAENHPNLKSNIMSVFKYAAAIMLGWGAIRYRHSIPWLKSICRTPKKTPPNFMNDLRKIWQSIVNNK